MESKLQQYPQNSIQQYSDEQLIRLFEQFSNTEQVEDELYKRYCQNLLSAVTLPAKLLNAWRQRGIL